MLKQTAGAHVVRLIGSDAVCADHLISLCWIIIIIMLWLLWQKWRCDWMFAVCCGQAWAVCVLDLLLIVFCQSAALFCPALVFCQSKLGQFCLINIFQPVTDYNSRWSGVCMLSHWLFLCLFRSAQGSQQTDEAAGSSPDDEQPGPSRRKRQPSMSETMPLYMLCKEDLDSMDKEVKHTLS